MESVSKRYSVQLIESNDENIDGEKHCCFGIGICTDKNGSSIENLSADRASVSALIDLLRANPIDPDQLKEIAEDYLENRYGLLISHEYLVELF